MNMSFIGGNFVIQTNRKQLNANGGAREKAKWSSALDELVRNGYAIEKGFKGEIYELTQKGFELADKIKE